MKKTIIGTLDLFLDELILLKVWPSCSSISWWLISKVLLFCFLFFYFQATSQGDWDCEGHMYFYNTKQRPHPLLWDGKMNLTGPSCLKSLCVCRALPCFSVRRQTGRCLPSPPLWGRATPAVLRWQGETPVKSRVNWKLGMSVNLFLCLSFVFLRSMTVRYL